MVRTKDGVLLLDKEENGRIWVITLNRPDRLNAFNGELRKVLHETYWEFAQDDGAWVAILTGTGRAFGTGQDLRERAERNAAEAAGLPDPMVQMPDYLQNIFPLAESLNCWKPTIAAVNGIAVAGGFNHAMQCDIRIAADTARLGQPEINLGIIPGYGGTQRLARLIGAGRALELLLTGEQVGAAEAYRLGLVNRVVPAADLMAEAHRLAAAIAAKAPVAVRYVLEAVRCGVQLPLGEAQALEATLFGLVAGTVDMREGTRAFLEKRQPEFKGT